MSAISSQKLALLRSKEQRFRLYFALWKPWEMSQDTPLLVVADDSTGEPKKNRFLGKKGHNDFDPVINIGPNRLAFVGEDIKFDAKDSWTQGHNPGHGVNGLSWTFEDGSPGSASGEGPHQVSWDEPGLYKVRCQADGHTATRWVRVEASRTFTRWDIVSVGSVSGTVESGWQAQVTVQPNDDGKQGSARQEVKSFQGAGIFIEEERRDENGVWQRVNVSGHDEPSLLLAGYIMQNSIQRDANTHTMSLTITGLQQHMSLGYVHSMTSWWDEYVDWLKSHPDDGSISDLGLQGVEFTLQKMTMTDIVLWWTQRYTNVLEYHDFYGYYDDDQQKQDIITTAEGNLWSAYQQLAQNEFVWMFSDQGSALHWEPNPHITSRSWFNDTYDVRMTFTDQDLFSVEVTENLHRNVVWVYFRCVHTMNARQFNAYYPSKKQPEGSGQWLKLDNYKASDKDWVEKTAERLYFDGNRKYEVTLNCPMNRACTVPDRIRLTVDLPDRGISWSGKLFVVDSVSHAIDLTNHSFTTQIHAKEVI